MASQNYCFSGKFGFGGSHWASTHIQGTRHLGMHQAKSPNEDAVVCQELEPAGIQTKVIPERMKGMVY